MWVVCDLCVVCVLFVCYVCVGFGELCGCCLLMIYVVVLCDFCLVFL